MKWIKITVIMLFGALAAGLFAAHTHMLDMDAAAEHTIDPNGNVYLLSEQAELSKISNNGELIWTIELPTENEDGSATRYSGLIPDKSGGIYLIAQHYKRQVDAQGAVVESILTEEIQPYNGDGVKQDILLNVDKTALSQYSTEPYILKIQMHQDSLFAVCRDHNRFDVVQTYPYGETKPHLVFTREMGDEAELMEDFAVLSDGRLVYSTKEGGLFELTSDGAVKDLRPLMGSEGMAAGLSADETDSVYFTELVNRVFYRIDPSENTIERLYSPETAVNSSGALLFGQLRGAKAAGNGDFCAASIDADRFVWVRFGQSEYEISSVHKTVDSQSAAAIAGVFIGAAAAVWLLYLLLSSLWRRSMLTGRIVLYFVPVMLLVLGALTGGLLKLYLNQYDAGQQSQLAAAAKSTGIMLEEEIGNGLTMKRSYENRQTILGKLEEAVGRAEDISGLNDLGMILYSFESNGCFAVCYTNERDRFFSTEYLAPVELEFAADQAKAVYSCAAQGGSMTFSAAGNEYCSYFHPVHDRYGDTIGLLEARIECGQAAAGSTLTTPDLYIWILGGAAAALIVLWLLLVLVHAFSPLKELKRCIGEISAGNWSVSAKITSRDELADIGMSFNQMTEKLNQYISNMVLLNNEYIKFTPRELFQLMGKSKVTDLDLHDKSIRSISLLYVHFSNDGDTLGSEGYFSLMNENFDRIFDVVDKNRGIIERFDGSGMLALFPYQVRDAFNTAISLKEIIEREAGSIELKMLISADETLVGVAGNQKRQSIIAISETIMDIYLINSLMDELGTKYAATKRAVELASDDFYFNCREIGSGDSGRESLYEFLDGMDPYEKKLHLVTKEEFERGIADYQRQDYFSARKHFANVLQTNAKDRVAMHYLMLCDDSIRK